LLIHALFPLTHLRVGKWSWKRATWYRSLSGDRTTIL